MHAGHDPAITAGDQRAERRHADGAAGLPRGVEHGRGGAGNVFSTLAKIAVVIAGTPRPMPLGINKKGASIAR